MKKEELIKKIEEIDISYDYEDTYYNLYNTCIEYMNDSQDFKLDYLSTDLLFNMLTRGLENVEDKDIMMINNERIKNKLEPITKGEMLDYLQSLKDYLF